MPYTATSIVEVRADGNDANGGAYDPTIAGGTDYTYPVPQAFAYADLVLGTGGLTVSSATRPFVAADAGNFLNITSGTGFTVGRWRINSVAAGVATLQASAGTAGSTGGVGRLGGALASMAGLASALAGSAAGATCWIRGAAGELAINAQAILPAVGSATAPTRVLGYGSVRDDGIKPTIRIGSGVSLASRGAIFVLDNYVLSNLTLRSHNDLYTAAYSCIELRGANVYGDRLDVTGGFALFCAGPCRLLGCQIRDCDIFADIYFGTSSGRTVECHDIAIYGGRFVGNVGSVSVIDCRTSISPTRAVCGISQGNTNVGICRIARTTLSGGSQGIASTQPGTIVERCVVVGVAGTGISLVAGSLAIDNALWGNTTKYSGTTPVLRDILLTAQPLNNANAGDLRPNNVAGGGAVLREFALPSMINPYGANIGASGRIGGVTVPLTTQDIVDISNRMERVDGRLATTQAQATLAADRAGRAWLAKLTLIAFDPPAEADLPYVVSGAVVDGALPASGLADHILTCATLAGAWKITSTTYDDEEDFYRIDAAPVAPNSVALLDAIEEDATWLVSRPSALPSAYPATWPRPATSAAFELHLAGATAGGGCGCKSKAGGCGCSSGAEATLYEGDTRQRVFFLLDPGKSVVALPSGVSVEIWDQDAKRGEATITVTDPARWSGTLAIPDAVWSDAQTPLQPGGYWLRVFDGDDQLVTVHALTILDPGQAR